MKNKTTIFVSVGVILLASAAIGVMAHYHSGSPREIQMYLVGSSWTIDSTDLMAFDASLQDPDSVILRRTSGFLPVCEMVISVTNNVLQSLRVDSVTVTHSTTGSPIPVTDLAVIYPGSVQIDPARRTIVAHSSADINVQWYYRDADLPTRLSLRSAMLLHQFKVRVHTNRGSLNAKVIRYRTQTGGGVIRVDGYVDAT
jgi:hypothetical protein